MMQHYVVTSPEAWLSIAEALTLDSEHPQLVVVLPIDQQTLNDADRSSTGDSFRIGGTGGYVTIPGTRFHGKPMRLMCNLIGALDDKQKAEQKASKAAALRAQHDAEIARGVAEALRKMAPAPTLVKRDEA